MKALALTVLIASALALSMLTVNIVRVTVQTPDGSMNPVFLFQLQPGTRDEFLTCLLAAAIAAYFYAVVAWMDGKLSRMREEVIGDLPPAHLAQPLQVRLLKDAIRAGDLAAIGRYGTSDALDFCDERFMTPLELAELYGRKDVLEAVTKAVHGRAKPRFGIRVQTLESPQAQRQGTTP